jgi:sugar lactone lactonase YvrE
VLKSGFVLVGSLPTDYSTTPPTVNQGSLMILDSSGKVVETLSDNQLLDGPWFLAVNDMGKTAQVFVSNVLSGTVTRIDLRIPPGGKPVVESLTQIASGYAHRPDPNALVVGPAGLAFDAAHDVLYVASTGDNAIYAIRNAAVTHHDHGMGRLVVKDDAHLHGPLGLVLAPNGDLIVSNGDAQNPDPNQPNELDEFTTRGKFVGQFQLDKGAPGAAFGIAVSTVNGQLRFAAADDNTNSLDVWTFDSGVAVLRHHHHDSGDGDSDGDN